MGQGRDGLTTVTRRELIMILEKLVLQKSVAANGTLAGVSYPMLALIGAGCRSLYSKHFSPCHRQILLLRVNADDPRGTVSQSGRQHSS